MRAIGLELAAKQLRAVRGELRRGRWQSLQASAQPLPEEPAARAKALEEFLKAEAHRAKVVVGLPLDQTSVRILEYPPTSEANLARLAYVDATSHFGLPADSLDFGWAIINPGAAGQPAKVAAAVCRRQAQNAVLAPFEQADLDPAAVTPRIVALANLLHDQVASTGSTAALAWVEEAGAELALFDAKGELLVVRSVAGSPGAVWNELARTAQSTAEETGVASAIAWLAGPGANLAAAAAPASWQVRIVDPWALLGASPPSNMEGEASLWAPAVGLLMQAGEVALPLDLSSPPPLEVDQRARHLAPATWAAVAVLVALGLAIGWFATAWQLRSQRLDQVKGQVAQAEAALALAGGESSTFLALLSSTRDSVRADSDWLGVLRQLSERLPDGLAIEQFSGDVARGLIVSGQTLSPAAVTSLMVALNESGRFDPARLDSYTATNATANPIYAFQVSCRPRGTASRGAGAGP